MDQGHAIDLGHDVYSSDGQKLGSVDRLVLNSANQHLENLVVDRGLLSTGKLVDLDLVERVEDDRVVLSLSADQAEQLPNFVETQFVDAPDDVTARFPAAGAGALGGGRVLYGGPLVGAGVAGGGTVGAASGAGTAPAVENYRNIPEQDVVVGSGADVIGSDGKKVGTVDRVLYGKDGVLQGVVVKSGFLFKHEVTIPGDLVAELDDDRILLSVTADEVQD